MSTRRQSGHVRHYAVFKHVVLYLTRQPLQVTVCLQSGFGSLPGGNNYLLLGYIGDILCQELVQYSLVEPYPHLVIHQDYRNTHLA